MDNNYNIQNNNAGQYVYQQIPQQMPQNMQYQQMPQQPMIQPMNYEKPKKKKGLIIGLVIGIALVIVAVTITLLAIFVWGAEAELEGTWRTENGTEVVFEKVIENDDNEDGYIYYCIFVDGEKVVHSCPLEDNKIEIRYVSEEWSDEDGAYIYDVDIDEVKIVKLTKRKLVFEFEEEEYELDRE